MEKTTNIERVKFALSIVVVFVVFLWSLDLMTSSFKLIGNDTIQSILNITSNPFVSLFIGLFITAVIQSSSTSTSLIVAIVASGSLSLENAVPMIMGANIGTTLTSTIVSLSFITDREEFKNAISTGVVHDFFNIMNVIILFPLEYNYHLVSGFASSITALFDIKGLNSTATNTSDSGLFALINEYLLNLIEYKIVLILVSFACLLGSIKLISNIISNKMMGVATERFQSVFFKNSFKSFGLGTVFTAIVQSSSIATSIVVPIGASGQISIKKLYPFVVGANIGTTITALIAAFNKSEAAISIALVHFLINTIGTIIFLLFPIIKNLPVNYARKFGNITAEYKIIGLFYILLVFFIIPLALIYFFK